MNCGDHKLNGVQLMKAIPLKGGTCYTWRHHVLVSCQEGIGSYGSPDGGDAVFSGVGRLSQLYDRRPLFLGDGGSVSTVIAGSCFRKASENQSFIVLPPLDLSPETTRNVGGGWSMVDGSYETTQIVFDECLALSAWDTDEIAME
ncbi:hypothetical protein IGI04_025020 [Brassica rapa subsp. trilocularis]|uniref:Uncharacterized protein n=1 Tax=Brassica rapa subsp. trilocularis TaxID=1813537 RepID=A0ABQ7M8E4_BRACM|nr:hypothetical protein IGI04_025020 [Brassica rapa subsp. trilocularis]